MSGKMVENGIVCILGCSAVIRKATELYWAFFSNSRFTIWIWPTGGKIKCAANHSKLLSSHRVRKVATGSTNSNHSAPTKASQVVLTIKPSPGPGSPSHSRQRRERLQNRHRSLALETNQSRLHPFFGGTPKHKLPVFL